MDLMEQGTDRGDLPNQNPGDTSAPQGPNEQSSQDDNTTSEDGMEVSPDASQGPTTQHAVNDNNSQDNNMEADQSASQGPTTQLTQNDNTAGSLEINKEADHSAPQGPTKQLTENDNSSREKKRDDNHSAHQASAFQDSEEGISNNSEDNNMETEQSAPQGPTTQHAEDVNSQQKIEIDNHPAHQGSNEPNEQSSQDNNTAGSSENNTEADQSAPQGPTTQLTENDNTAGSLEINKEADHSAPQGPTTQPTEGDNMLRNRFFVQLEGKTNGAHQDFVTKLQLAGCIKVKSVKESDVLLVFCPIVSRVGTDINDALENIPDDKPTILVVMHPTFKTDQVVANSRKLVEKENIKLTVDCLFYNGKLLICDRNDTAWTEIKRFLNLSSPQASTTNINAAVAQDKKPGKHSDPKVSTSKSNKGDDSNSSKKKFFVKLEGKTNGAHENFVTRLKDIGHIHVESLEDSEILLVFCPIVTRAEMDITNALENIPDGKQTILVMMHPNFNPDKVVADSRKLVKKLSTDEKNVKLTVDCLFHDGKLLNCNRNETAWASIQSLVGVPPSEGYFNAFQVQLPSFPKRMWPFNKDK